MRSADARPFALLTGLVTLGAILVGGLLLVQVLVDPSSRKTAARLVAAAVLAIVAFRARTLVGAGIARQPRSTFETAHERPVVLPPDRSHFEQLHAEMRFSTRNHRYFEYVLWPRLCALAAPASGEPPAWLEKPPGRSFGRGPSLAALEGLVASIERRQA